MKAHTWCLTLKMTSYLLSFSFHHLSHLWILKGWRGMCRWSLSTVRRNEVKTAREEETSMQRSTRESATTPVWVLELEAKVWHWQLCVCVCLINLREWQQGQGAKERERRSLLCLQKLLFIASLSRQSPSNLFHPACLSHSCRLGMWDDNLKKRREEELSAEDREEKHLCQHCRHVKGITDSCSVINSESSYLREYKDGSGRRDGIVSVSLWHIWAHSSVCLCVCVSESAELWVLGWFEPDDPHCHTLNWILMPPRVREQFKRLWPASQPQSSSNTTSQCFSYTSERRNRSRRIGIMRNISKRTELKRDSQIFPQNKIYFCTE